MIKSASIWLEVVAITSDYDEHLSPTEGMNGGSYFSREKNDLTHKFSNLSCRTHRVLKWGVEASTYSVF